MESLLARYKSLIAALIIILVAVGVYFAYFRFRIPVNYSTARIVFNATAAKSATTSAIYLVRSDGSELIKVSTDATTEGTHPTWNKDKNLIFFASSAVNYQILSMAPDAKSPTILTLGPTPKSEPAISPDGTKLAYVNIAFSTNQTIQVFDYTTGLTKTMVKDGINYSPTWVTNSKLLYVHNDAGKDQGIYSIENGQSTNLTSGTSVGRTFAVSPDGRSIVYVNKDDGQLYTMDINGGGKKKLTSDKDGYLSNPSFSPEGKTLVAILSSAISGSDLPPQAKLATTEAGFGTKLVTVDPKSGQVTVIPYLTNLYNVNYPNWSAR